METHLMSAYIIQIVVTKELLVWREEDVMGWGFEGRFEIFLSPIRESQGSQSPEVCVSIVLEVR